MPERQEPASFDWELLGPLLEQLVDLPPEDHADFLARACSGNRALERKLASLVKAGQSSAFLSPPPPVLAATQTGESVGPYRLVRPIGQGGMGEVWLAERADGAFDKRVAIKLIQRGLATPDLLTRFETERQVLAWLEHPGIARIIDGGLHEDGRPFLAMEFVDGVSIDRYAEEHELSIEQRIGLFCAVCEAVQHAHGRGVVHRDLKPGNVLVDSDGKPRLLDFGIAKVLGGEDEHDRVELTRTGQQLFSPPYASPEQVRGEPVTAATDVYALGVMLCELLTGSRPYDTHTTSQLELERVICETRPAKPSDLVETRTLRRELRGDLDWIVATALRKEPERRYANVAALLSDLRRHLDGRRVLARPDSVTYRAITYARRNRPLVGGALALLLGLVASLILWRTSVRSENESRAVAYASSLQAAEAAIRNHQVKVARGHLDQAPPGLRGWEWRHLRSRLDRSECLIESTGTSGGLALSPNGQVLATLDNSGLVSLWSYERRELIRERSLSVEPAAPYASVSTSVNFDPTGELLAVATRDKRVIVLDTASLETVREFDLEGIHLRSAIFSPDGHLLVCGIQSGEIVVFDYQSGSEVARWKAHSSGEMHLTFNSAGDLLASGSWDQMARTWSVPSFELVREFKGHSRHVTNVAFAGNDDLLVTSSLDGTARVWALNESTRPRVFRRHETIVGDLVVAPDGNTVFSSGDDGTILRWSVHDQKILGVMLGHRLGAQLLYHNEGYLISANGAGGPILQWKANTVDVAALNGCEFQRSISLNPARDEFAVSGPDGLLRRWSLADLSQLESIRMGRAPVIAVAYNQAGDLLFGCDEDGWIRCWSLPDLELQQSWRAGAKSVRRATFDSKMRWAVIASVTTKDSGYRRIDLTDPKAVGEPLLSGFRAVPPESNSGAVFLGDRASGKVWRVETATWELNLVAQGKPVGGLAIDAGGQRILVGYSDADADQNGEACLFESGRLAWATGGVGGAVMSAAFHPTEARIAIGTSTGGVEILDAFTGRKLVRLGGHRAGVEDLVYTQDGERLLSCSADGTVRVWDVR